MTSPKGFNSALELVGMRSAAGWTQHELGLKAGFSRGAVKYWEAKEGRIEGVAPAAFLVALVRHKADLDEEGPPGAATTSATDTQHKTPCGAKTRGGTPCKASAVAACGRCKLHGGNSTGPKTEEGRERIRAAQYKRWRAWRKHRTLTAQMEKIRDERMARAARDLKG